MNEFPVPGGFWDLPTCPEVAQHILNLVPLGPESTQQVLDAVRWDPAICARMLAAAFATETRQPEPPVSLEQARSLLGDVPFRLLALQFRLDRLSPERESFGVLYETFWKRSRYRALATRMLLEEDGAAGTVDPFLAALLCDLGRLALIQSHPNEAQNIHETVLETAAPYDEVERSILPAELREAQHRLLFQADLPVPFLKAVKSRQALGNPTDSHISTLARALEVADAVADLLCFENENPPLAARWQERLQNAHTRFCSENPSLHSSLGELIAGVRQNDDARFPAKSLPSSASILLHQANRELGRLAWEASLACHQAQQRAEQAEESLHRAEKKTARLKQQALRDPLTDIYNRRFLLEALQNEVARCRRQAAPIGLLFVDVDSFKTLNDTKGHLVGDLVLRKVAEALQNLLRAADVLARYDGEEFVILPNAPTEDGIVQLAERVRLAIEQLAVPVDGERVSVTVSVGCTLTVPHPNDWDLVPQLLASADAAMYDAKQLGRNRVAFRPMLSDSERELMQQTIECSFSRWLVERNVLDEETLEGVLMDYVPERFSLGDLAIDMGLLAESQVAEIFESQTEAGERFGSLALKRGWLTSEELACLLARQRENPMQLARLLIAQDLLPETEALDLVHEFLNQPNAKGRRDEQTPPTD